MTIALIFCALVLLIVILYLADFRFEFRYMKSPDQGKSDLVNSKLNQLSNSEFEIFKLVSKGKTNKEIADLLHISVYTVKKHISNIFKKLNMRSRSETRRFKELIDK